MKRYLVTRTTVETFTVTTRGTLTSETLRSAVDMDDAMPTHTDTDIIVTEILDTAIGTGK